LASSDAFSPSISCRRKDAFTRATKIAQFRGISGPNAGMIET
jgi:hypothetical protein